MAVKWVAMKANTDMQEIKMQLDALCKLRHRHLVTLLGYCMDDIFAAGDEDAHDNNKSESLFIVSEYVERGDLRSLLASKIQLPTFCQSPSKTGIHEEGGWGSL